MLETVKEEPENPDTFLTENYTTVSHWRGWSPGWLQDENVGWGAGCTAGLQEGMWCCWWIPSRLWFSRMTEVLDCGNTRAMVYSMLSLACVSRSSVSCWHARETLAVGGSGRGNTGLPGLEQKIGGQGCVKYIKDGHKGKCNEQCFMTVLYKKRSKRWTWQRRRCGFSNAWPSNSGDNKTLKYTVWCSNIICSCSSSNGLSNDMTEVDCTGDSTVV